MRIIKIKLHSQKKGKLGEVDFCRWLDDNLQFSEKRQFGEKTERNYNQADGNSADIIVHPFIFEIKRREKLDLKKWWLQVVIAKNSNPNPALTPVVAFRQNRKKWEFLIPAQLIGLEEGWLHTTENTFIDYARNVMNSECEVD